MVDLLAGDRLVLTSDGVHSFVDDLASLLTLAAPPQNVADAAAEAVTRAGKPDTHTLVVVDLASWRSRHQRGITGRRATLLRCTIP